MSLVLDFRDRDTGGAVVQGVLRHSADRQGPDITSQLPTISAGKNVCFLLHGFNVSRPEGLSSLLPLATALEADPDWLFIAVLWPGDHWTGPISYSFEGTDAAETAAELAGYVESWVADNAILHFASHSLGGRVVLRTILELDGRGATHSIGEVCLTAPAVDDDCLHDPDEFRDVTSIARRVSVLASRKDRVLKLVYPAGDLLQAFIFFDEQDFGLALGLRGPKRLGHAPLPPSVDPLHRQIPKVRKSRHSHYFPPFPTDPTPGSKELRQKANIQSAIDFIHAALSGSADPHYP